ncbi:MAG: fibrobacter succinogenes major paralogous domain-containing protein [Ferruginibacter sp.]
MKKTTILLIVLLVGLLSITQAQTMQEVQIGKQVWAKMNLNVDHFRNGDPIPQAKNKAEWAAATEKKQPVWCYYGYQSANGKKYGKLYNWYAVNDARGLAPAGWHIPHDGEWRELVTYCGKDEIAGQSLKSITGWAKGMSATNGSGFSALPGGACDEFGNMNKLLKSGRWWTSTPTSFDDWPWLFGVDYDRNSVLISDYYTSGCGVSVRCVKD